MSLSMWAWSICAKCVSPDSAPCDLSEATCSRRLWPDGQRMEIVTLDGAREGVSDRDLEKFIHSFPIERIGSAA